MKSLQYIIALDQGTSSTRAVLFNEQMQIVDLAQESISQTFPHPGWVEQGPELIWQSVLKVLKNILEKNKDIASHIVGMGITNQRETTIVWDKQTGRALYPAIGWQDRRTATQCEQWRAELPIEKITQKTGLLIDPYFSATKLYWILDNVPEAKMKVKEGNLLFGTIDTFLLWRLTAGKSHKTDATNAARTLLFNISTQQWDTELLTWFNIPNTILPTVFDNSAEFGITDHNLLGYSIPITAMAGDQQAALIGQACFKPGMVKSTYGTGAFMVANVGETLPSLNQKLITTVAYRLNGVTTYAIEGSIFVAGSAIKWLRDKMHFVKHVDEIPSLLEQANNESDLYIIPAFAGLGAPYWRPEVRGAIMGMDLNTSTADIVSATIKGIAYRTRDVLEAMNLSMKAPINVLRVDGGMAANDQFLQLLADIVNVRVERPTIIETTVLGVAYLAALQAKWFDSLDSIGTHWHCEQTLIPRLETNRREAAYAGWQAAIEKVLS